MRTQRLAIPLLLVLPAAALAAPFVPAALSALQEEPERLLKERDVEGLGKKLGAWYELKEAGKDTLEAEQEFREELEKVNDKKLKGGDLLSSPADLGAVIYEANDYPKKSPKRVEGKVVMQSEKFKDIDVEYAIWTPGKYKAKTGPYPLVLSIPEEGVNPEAHITDRFQDNAFKDGYIIAAPKMPGDAKTWDGDEGRQAVLLTLRYVTRAWAVDADRIFIGGRGRGGEVALNMAQSSPDRFAGVFAWASDAGDGVDPENLRHTPVIISGGGARATAFGERAKKAGLDGITLEPSAALPEFIEWFSEKRRVGYPDKITLVPQGKYPYRSHWLRFSPVADSEGVRIDAEVNRETNTITVNSDGIRDVSIFFCDGLVDLDKPVTVIANGTESVQTIPRSVKTFLDFLVFGYNDAGRVFVATKQFHLPAVASKTESDDGSGDPK